MSHPEVTDLVNGVIKGALEAAEIVDTSACIKNPEPLATHIEAADKDFGPSSTPE